MVVEPILTVDKLAVKINSSSGVVYAVDDVSFEINPGQTLALIGESGCGKSITALALMRLLPANAMYSRESKIFLQSTNLLDITEKQMRSLRGNKIAMIFQDPMQCLNPVLTVGEQIAEVFRAHDIQMSGAELNSAVLELLDKVRIPEPQQKITAYPHELSGGMKQRVMIAMALAARPVLLIADEPTTALDVITQQQILSLLKELCKTNNMGMVFITHDLAVAANIADQVAVMYAGHLLEYGAVIDYFPQAFDQASTPDLVIRTAQHPYTQGLFLAQPNFALRNRPLPAIPGMVPMLSAGFSKCRFIDRCPHANSLCQQQLPPLQPKHDAIGWVRCHHVNANMHDEVAESDATAEAVMPTVGYSQYSQILAVRNLQVDYPIRQGVFRRTIGNRTAVKAVNFTVAAGETLAIVGESGSGKSTIAKAILALIMSGSDAKVSGVVEYASKNLLVEHAMTKSLRRELQIIFQDPFAALNPRMRVFELIIEGILEHYQPCNGKVDKEILANKVDQLLKQVGLDVNYKWRYPHEFSGGQRQRICIARALALEPKILICDEPTSALDISVQAQILNLLKSLQQATAMAYIFISHNISVVGYMADKIAVLYAGEIVEYGLAEQVMQAPVHPYTKSLLSAALSLGE